MQETKEELENLLKRQQALGSLQDLPFELKTSLQQITPLFRPMPEPQFNDWLVDHNQIGQSFAAYNDQVHNHVNKERNIIYILPLEQILQLFLDQLKQYCQCFFHPMKVEIMETGNLKNITHRLNPWGNIKQYNAKQILVDLRKQVPQDGFCLIGVCMTDLYPKQEWNFVFGLASFKQRTGVFSFARYEDNFYQSFNKDLKYYHQKETKGTKNKTKLIKVINQKTLWRSISVMVHQITHMFGIKHCIFYRCVMNGYNHLQQLDSTPLQLCPVCLRKMQSNINFNILERYKNLLKFFQKRGDKSGKAIQQFLTNAIKNIQQSFLQKK